MNKTINKVLTAAMAATLLAGSAQAASDFDILTGAATANIAYVPAFPTVDTHTAASVEYFDNAAGNVGSELSIFMENDLGIPITYEAAAMLISNDTVFTKTIGGVTVSNGAQFAFINSEDFFALTGFGLSVIPLGATLEIGLDIESSNDWHKQGSGSMDLGGGTSLTLGYGQTDLSLVGTMTYTDLSESQSISEVIASEQVTNVTVGVSKVAWSDNGEAVVVGMNYGTESNLSVSAGYHKNTMMGKGMLQTGLSAGHNVDSGITGFGAMVGFDNGVQPEGFDGAYAGFSLTDGLMSVGIVDVDTDGTRHNLTLNPIGIVINTLMGNDTVLNHNFHK